MMHVLTHVDGEDGNYIAFGIRLVRENFVNFTTKHMNPFLTTTIGYADETRQGNRFSCQADETTNKWRINGKYEIEGSFGDWLIYSSKFNEWTVFDSSYITVVEDIDKFNGEQEYFILEPVSDFMTNILIDNIIDAYSTKITLSDLAGSLKVVADNILRTPE